jgi:DNA repair protein RecO (recombination protein O)
MSQTYKATGINLKSIPLGEADKILTILTREHGLIRAVAPGSRKPRAKLGGRSELFVVNDLLLNRGRSLDRLSQAESIESYPRLSRDLAKLTVSQYWAEVVLYQTPSHDPNEALFDLFCQRLDHLIACESGLPVLIHLVYGVMQFLSLAGVAPQVDRCCVTGQSMTPESIENGRVIFSPAAGGVISTVPEELAAAEHHSAAYLSGQGPVLTSVRDGSSAWPKPNPKSNPQPNPEPNPEPNPKPKQLIRNRHHLTLSASELSLMQQLALDDDLMTPPVLSLSAFPADVTQWLNVEKALRAYVHFQTERPIRSAALLESCFNPKSALLHSTAVSAAHP